MLFLLALTYILLCVRIRVRLEAEVVNRRGSAALCLSAPGVSLRREYDIVGKGSPLLLRLVPRHGSRRKKKKPASAFFVRWLRDYTLGALRRGHFECLAIDLRLGLGDACETAVAAGVMQALLCALLAHTGNRRACALSVVPEFSGTCLHGRLMGVFSCQVGDVILAALKTARRNRKERLKRTSIPLSA